jgi:hypothetical protein
MASDAASAVRLVKNRYLPEDGMPVEEYREQTIEHLEDRATELEEAPDRGLPLVRYTARHMKDGWAFSLARVGLIPGGTGFIGGGAKVLYESSHLAPGQDSSMLATAIGAGSIAMGTGMLWAARNGFRPTVSKLVQFAESITEQAGHYRDAVDRLEQVTAQDELDALKDPSLDDIDAIAAEYEVDTVMIDYDHGGEPLDREVVIDDILTEPITLSYYHPKGAYHALAWVEDDHWVREDFHESWPSLLHQGVRLYRDGRPTIEEYTVTYPEQHAAAEGIDQAGIPDAWTETYVDRPS